LAAGLVQSSGQVGAALVLAVVTALVTVTGPAEATADFTQYHPGINLVTGIALAGLLLNVIPMINRKRRLATAA
jgi:NADH:ubiquinone oxidoreductase subunit 6 (subunit J)